MRLKNKVIEGNTALCCLTISSQFSLTAPTWILQQRSYSDCCDVKTLFLFSLSDVNIVTKCTKQTNILNMSLHVSTWVQSPLCRAYRSTANKVSSKSTASSLFWLGLPVRTEQQPTLRAVATRVKQLKACLHWLGLAWPGLHWSGIVSKTVSLRLSRDC